MFTLSVRRPCRSKPHRDSWIRSTEVLTDRLYTSVNRDGNDGNDGSESW